MPVPFADTMTSDVKWPAMTDPLRLSDLSRQRVAVCMVGAVRTLLSPLVYKSVKRHLLDAQLVPADLFLHLHLGWDHTAFAPGMGMHGAKGDTVKRDDPRLQIVLRYLKPVQTDLTETSDCASEEMGRTKVCQMNMKKSNRGGGLAGYLQYMWINRCFNTAVQHERTSNLTYSWVIRTRPDVAFFDRVPSPVTMTPRRMVMMMKESNPAYFDGFFMVPRGLLDDFIQGSDAFWTTRAHGLPWPPEWHLFPYLRSARKLPWGYALVPAALVRNAPGYIKKNRVEADCFRLSLKESPQFVYEAQGTSWGRADGGKGALLSFRQACEAFFQQNGNTATAPAPALPSAPYRRQPTHSAATTMRRPVYSAEHHPLGRSPPTFEDRLRAMRDG